MTNPFRRFGRPPSRLPGPRGTAIHTYLYDARGNRASEATSGGTAGFTYETGTNRLASRTTYGARYYKHDAYGYRIYDSPNAWSGTKTLYFNDENRLVEVRDPSNPSTVKGTYVYDAFGRRVKKVGNGVTQVFFYGPDGQMVEEVSPRRPLFTTDVARRYVHVDGEVMGVVSQEVAVGTSAWTPVAWQARPPETRAPLAILLATLVAAGLLTLHPRARRAAAAVAVSGAALSLHSCTPAAAFAWVHTDILGTPLAVTDSPATGTAIKVVWRASYEPFGNATVAPNLDGDGNSANDFVLHVRFPGQYFDGESGYHYNYFRTYDPATGRYIEPDPIGQWGGLNAYSYAHNDPVRFIDVLRLATQADLDFAVRWFNKNRPNGAEPIAAEQVVELVPFESRFDEGDRGEYSRDTGEISLAAEFVDMPELIETLAHEAYHARQGWFSRVCQDGLALVFKDDRENWIHGEAYRAGEAASNEFFAQERARSAAGLTPYLYTRDHPRYRPGSARTTP